MALPATTSGRSLEVHSTTEGRCCQERKTWPKLLITPGSRGRALRPVSQGGGSWRTGQEDRSSTQASWQEHPKRAGSTPGHARAAERQNPAGLPAHFGSNHTAACANFRRALHALPHVVTFPFTHPPTHPTRLINTEKKKLKIYCVPRAQALKL